MMSNVIAEDTLNKLKPFYTKLKLKINEIQFEESQDYGACNLKLNALSIKMRTSKITPTKIGQFVSIWKRNFEGITEPHRDTDDFDFFVINAIKSDLFGQFIFPKEILIKKGIISSKEKEGKRGFRVYPPWDKAVNKQAISSQKWQLEYFIEVSEKTDFEKLEALYLREFC